MIENLLQQLGKLSHIKNEKEMTSMWSHFQKDAPKSFGQNHFELAAITGVDPAKWEEFKKIPAIQKYIQEQMAIINEANQTKAMVRLGDATTSTDIQAAKLARDMSKTEAHRSSKPFTIQYLPIETLKYKKALMEIGQRVQQGAQPYELLDIVWSVIPPSKEELDAITKARESSKA